MTKRCSRTYDHDIYVNGISDDRIVTYEQDKRVETKLVKAPHIKGNKVMVDTPDGQRAFGLKSVLAWVFGGKTHMPDR